MDKVEAFRPGCADKVTKLWMTVTSLSDKGNGWDRAARTARESLWDTKSSEGGQECQCLEG